MRLADSNKVVQQKVAALLTTAIPRVGSRMALAEKIGVGDGTLGRIVYGTGNPSVSTLDQIAHYFRVSTWQLLKPDDADVQNKIAEVRSMTTPRSADALEAISRAAREGKLTETDLILLQQISLRFMSPAD